MCITVLPPTANPRALLSCHCCQNTFYFIIANAYAGLAEVLGHFSILVPVLTSGAGLARCDCSTMPFNSFLLATSCSLVGETYSVAAWVGSMWIQGLRDYGFKEASVTD